MTTATITIPILPAIMGIIGYFALAIVSRDDKWWAEFTALAYGATVFFAALGMQIVILGG